MKEIIVTKSQENQRLDKFLKKYFKSASPSFIYKMLRKKNITLNSKKDDGSSIIKENDIIKVFFSDETFEKMRGNCTTNSEYNYYKNFKYNVDILYEDSDIIALNKPSGILSQKSKANDISINEHLLSYLICNNKITEEEYSVFHPSISNRLDYNTSGIILGAKTLKGQQELSKALKERTITKKYLCVVKGEVNKKIVLKGSFYKDQTENIVYINNNKGDEVITEIDPIEWNKDYSVLEIHLITGKTHQIRAHLASINHPIIGDIKYGDKKCNDYYIKNNNVKSQLLHACYVEYKDIKIYSKQPKEMEGFINGNLEFKRT